MSSARTSPPASTRGRLHPFIRWPRAADAALALTLLLVTVFVAEGPHGTLVVRDPGELPTSVVLALTAAAVALYWRRSAPVLVTAVGLLAWVTVVAMGHGEVGAPPVFALYSLGRYEHQDMRALPLLGAASVMALVTATGRTWAEASLGAVAVCGLWLAGRSRRLQRTRLAERAAQQAAELRQILLEERTRIARELHDVVAHQVGLMTVQASAAKAVASHDLPAAIRAMSAVEQAGRDALGELRHLLGVLRPDPGEAELQPQPGLDSVPALVERVRVAGLDVTLTAHDLPENLPARVDLFAYRIVQEALTNVLKHAGPGTHARVLLRGEREELVVEVVDDGPAAVEEIATSGQPSPTTGAGHGIIGMRERATLVGGRLTAGPQGRGFAVVAHLPAGKGAP